MKLSVGIIRNTLTVIILIVISFTMLNDTAADVNEAAGNLSDSSGVAYATYPLMNFFKKKGILLLAFVAGIVILFIGAFLGGK